MPVEMVIPFSLGPDGGLAMVADPYRRAAQRVKALVGTNPGERVMDNQFGVPLRDVIFEADDDITQAEITDMVSEALATYEPGVVVHVVTPEVNEYGDGINGADVQIQLTEDPATPGSAAWVNTATIRPTGAVSEVIRG